ncbi:hypothetical protein PsorP6_000294 [Peronosclerospora sorghi]|uniref:Uncharacterized protein n=1 Tax=Peronosclerospora sorghi TaxID=230839 RepID=A0ACC0WST1_9STRA|nr:hypothetical protein PsorP6_000294 [Peronosclerospora sorghi]
MACTCISNRQQQSVIRYFVYSKEYDQALEFTENSETLKLSACKMLIRDNGSEYPATTSAGMSEQFPRMSEQFPEVDTTAEDTLQNCTDYLLKYPVIGFDSEWKALHISSGSDDSPAKCALLQLASLQNAFVVDVIALYNHGNILAPLFQSESVIKLGFDTRADVKALRPFLTGGFASDNVISMLVDLQAVTRKLSNFQAPSRQAYSFKPRSSRRKILGIITRQAHGMSDWEHRPLTQAQLHYAALDAHVLLQIFYKMQEQHPPGTFTLAFKRCTQKHVK